MELTSMRCCEESIESCLSPREEIFQYFDSIFSSRFQHIEEFFNSKQQLFLNTESLVDFSQLPQFARRSFLKEIEFIQENYQRIIEERFVFTENQIQQIKHDFLNENQNLTNMKILSLKNLFFENNFKLRKHASDVILERYNYYVESTNRSNYLEEWYLENLPMSTYPSKEQKERLAIESGKTLQQVQNFFNNKRNRLKKKITHK